MSGRASPDEVRLAALAASFPLFVSSLVDLGDRPYEVPAHVLRWAELMVTERRLVLRAPRGHGKTTLLLAYVAWCCWRHGRTSAAGGPGTYEAVLFSATREQAHELMARFRDLLLANEPLFADLLPTSTGPARRRTRWSATEVRLANGASLRIRSYRTSVRGLHPDLLLLDDVLNDANSLSEEQRDKTYQFFMGTLLPMGARQIIVIGTAIHQADLLARIGRIRGDATHTVLGFRAETYHALDEATGDTLWPERFPAAELAALRDADPLIFSREYQNDPRDDASSLFPFELTQRAIDAGGSLVLGVGHPADVGEFVVLGVDVATSEAARADFTVIIVVAWDSLTGRRRILDIRREKGLSLTAQVELICDLAARHRITLGMVEDNGFQQWLIDALWQRPETRSRIFGHRTGAHKGDLRDGVPRLALEFAAGSWVIPSGDAASLRLARRFQAELAAFGYKDGRLAGVGEHDDMVIAAWHAELAILRLEEMRAMLADQQLVTMEDLGIRRVRIGGDY